jgi:NADH:ubiquinone oxidoreductase subunit H
MSGITWGTWPARVVSWFCLFAILAVGQCRLERWLIARFHRHGRAARLPAAPCVQPKPIPHPVQKRMRFLAALLGLLAGAAIPLAPDLRIGPWRVPLHLFGGMDLAFLYALSLEWVNAGMIALADDGGAAPSRWQAMGGLVTSSLPILLLLLSLVVTVATLDPAQKAIPSPVEIIALQGPTSLANTGSAGGRWLCAWQPLAALLWLIGGAPLRPALHAQATLAWRIHALNRALLFSTFFLGGWQGPLAASSTALGFLFTALQVGLVTTAWTWAWVSLPPLPAAGQLRTARTLMPAAALNLLVTVLVAMLSARSA